MRTTTRALGLLLVSLLLPVGVAAQPFGPAEYAARRARLMDAIPGGAAVFLGAATPAGDYEFRQGHDFLYFTGVEIPNAFLVIDAIEARERPLLHDGREDGGRRGHPARPRARPGKYTGIESVLPAEQFGAFLAFPRQPRSRAVHGVQAGRTGPREQQREVQRAAEHDDDDPGDGRLTRELQFVRQLRDRLPHVEIRDSSKEVWNLRKIKSPAELEVMRRGGPHRREGPHGAHPVDAPRRGGTLARGGVRVHVQGSWRAGPRLLQHHHVGEEPRLRPLPRVRPGAEGGRLPHPGRRPPTTGTTT